MQIICPPDVHDKLNETHYKLLWEVLGYNQERKWTYTESWFKPWLLLFQFIFILVYLYKVVFVFVSLC